jgi:hypothetical protein
VIPRLSGTACLCVGNAARIKNGKSIGRIDGDPLNAITAYVSPSVIQGAESRCPGSKVIALSASISGLLLAGGDHLAHKLFAQRLALAMLFLDRSEIRQGIGCREPALAHGIGLVHRAKRRLAGLIPIQLGVRSSVLHCRRARLQIGY